MPRKVCLYRTNAALLVILTLCGLASTKHANRVNDSAVRDLLNSLLESYDKRLRPNYTGEAVTVGVDLSILRFGKVDPLKMAYEVDMFFRQQWYDHRLKHDLGRTITLTVGNSHPASFVWVPDTVFINSVTSSMHSVTVQNHKLDIHESGKIFWGTRVTVSPNCRLNLRSYPMDTQKCNFEIVSYAHSARDLLYHWKTKPGIKVLDSEMAQFQMIQFSTKRNVIIFVAGNYTVLTATFIFKRLMGHSILQIYIPCFSIVCVSWISLWIDRKATPARIALCITTLLTVATIWGAANASLPRVNYIKAIDVYLMTSFCFVLLTLIEYVLVLNCEHMKVNCRKRKKNRSSDEVEEVLLKSTRMAAERQTSNGSAETTLRHNNWSPKLTGKLTNPGPSHYSNGFPIVTNVVLTPDKKIFEFKKVSIADIIENSARVLLPFAFVSFNCAYWIKYLHSNIEHKA